jgi:phosphoserine phosphatase
MTAMSPPPLASWNDCAAKSAIFTFVRNVADASSALFVPPAERIAAIDHDGTLWCEKPQFVQMTFILESLKGRVDAIPALAGNSLIRAALNGQSAAGLTMAKLIELASAAGAGPTPEEYEASARAWLAGARHPRFHVPYTQLVYQPMIELLHYLRDNGFKIVICSGGGIEFVRSIAEELYGVPREYVIGTALDYDLKEHNGRLWLDREPSLYGPGNEGSGKPINMQAHIGRQPIMAVGNSTGDIEMLRMAQAGRAASLCLMINHDDAEREYAYPAQGVPAAARRHGWHMVSMKNDWRRLF